MEPELLNQEISQSLRIDSIEIQDRFEIPGCDTIIGYSVRHHGRVDSFAIARVLTYLEQSTGFKVVLRTV